MPKHEQHNDIQTTSRRRAADPALKGSALVANGRQEQKVTDNDAADGETPIFSAPFERGFPPTGGAALTRSYLPVLERAKQERRTRRRKG